MSKPKIGNCSMCGRKNVAMTGKVCHSICYRRYFWKKKLKTCPRCKRLKYLKGKGLCGGCYNSVYQLDNIKDYNNQKRHNIPPELYKKITKECIVCNFTQFVELHHLDCNRHNSDEDNLVGLCPNHHKMLHTLEYNKEVFEKIKLVLKSKKEQKTLEAEAPTLKPLEIPINRKT